MREIEFRGKRIDNGEWVFGSPLVEGDGRKIVVPKKGMVGRLVDWLFGNLVKEKSKYCNDYYIKEIEVPFRTHGVDPKTVGQYTGLKDKNNVKIFEGDIIKSVAQLNDHHQKGATEILVVRYWCGNACLCFKNQESGVPIFPFCVGHEIEVIGNIHDNPELLEVLEDD